MVSVKPYYLILCKTNRQTFLKRLVLQIFLYSFSVTEQMFVYIQKTIDKHMFGRYT